MGNLVTQQETPTEDLVEAEDDDCVIVGFKSPTEQKHSTPPTLPPLEPEKTEAEMTEESEQSEEEGISDVESEQAKLAGEQLKNLSSTAQSSNSSWSFHVGVACIVVVSGAFLLLRKKL